jgi:DNA ligase (NAD+)
MPVTDAKTRHAELCAQIAQHDHAYYVLDAAVISDRAYDELFSELKALEQQHPELVQPGSPTQRVGESPREGVAKRVHRYPMFSLDNTYNEQELREFDRRVRDGLPGSARYGYVAEPKLDGASLEVVYRDGALALGITRGNGKVGEDVTENVRTIRALPLRIPETGELTLRGEVVIYRRDLAAINEARVAVGEEPFANPRNAAAGWLRLLDSREAATRPLRVFVYDLVERRRTSHTESLAWLAELGLPTHGLHEPCTDLDAVLRYVERFDKKRLELPYDTDGVVVKVDLLEQRDLLGSTARFPRWAIAYKYAAERAQTVVRGIRCDLGRTGALTPVADLDPVQLSGTVVARASLHNIDYVAEKDVRIGDSVIIEKAGEIIPQVIQVVLDARPADTAAWQPPTECPVCGSAVGRAEDEAALRCPNPRCPGRVKAGLFHFARRGAMDVENLGYALIDQLVDRGLLADVADLFALPARRAELLTLERMGDKSVDNLLGSIEAARTGRSFAQLLAGLGIPLLGSVAASLLARRFGDLPSLLALEPAALAEQLAELHGIGPKMAASLTAYLTAPESRAVLEKLVALGVTSLPPEPVAAQVEGPLSGKSFCVTGVLSRPREAVHAAIRAAGGEVHDRIKKGTSYLVAGEKVGKSKLDGARKHGAEVIDEAALERLLAPAPTP